ncbi:MAG: hypothetical protein CMB78_03240 [Euryarchaeota archaeon]|nr:hypothetical protein [Euryarchaeota archaeon]
MGWIPSRFMASGDVELAIIGISQDGGVPQAGCDCVNCESAILDPRQKLHPVSCAIRGSDGSLHLIEATRDLAEQLSIASRALGMGVTSVPDTISLTHAHLGHIDGIGQFGKESMGLRNLPLYASQSVTDVLYTREAVSPFMINVIEPGVAFSPSESCGFTFTMVPVPHRDEFSDTHAILVEGPRSNLLFLPDHDEWSQTLEFHGCVGIKQWLASMGVDFALLDGTFWDKGELIGRDIREVPHPSISETLEMIGDREDGDPEVNFIHINHTNPVLDRESIQYKDVISRGWSIGMQGTSISL